MTPDDLARIEAITNRLPAVADRFSTFFYDTLFEIDPEARDLFPDDLTRQRTKLFDELQALVALGMELADGGTTFSDRARALGGRHIGYGASPSHYELLGQALLVALADVTPDWGPQDRTSWTRLYALVANTMLEGQRVE